MDRKLGFRLAARNLSLAPSDRPLLVMCPTCLQVNEIIGGAVKAGAECIVTACAVCQLNLEIRCTLKDRIPTPHFSEILALAFGAKGLRKWFRRHLVDPMPRLKAKNLTP